MARPHSTETELPELDDITDIIDEMTNINQAFACYHDLMSCYVHRTAESTQPPEAVSSFLNGSQIIFYSILSRLERIQAAAQKIT